MKLELHLESDCVAPGEHVRGSAHVVEGGRARSLEARLLRMPQSADRSNVIVEDRVELLQAESELPVGGSYDFRLSVPAAAVPTCESPHGRIDWQVDVKADVPHGRDRSAECPLLLSASGATGPEQYDQSAKADVQPSGHVSAKGIWGVILILAGLGLGAFVIYSDTTGTSGGIAVAGGLTLVGVLLLLWSWRSSAGKAKRFSLTLGQDMVARGAELKGRVDLTDFRGLEDIRAALVCWEYYEKETTDSEGRTSVSTVTHCMHFDSQALDPASPEFRIRVPETLPPSSPPAALYFEWEVVATAKRSGRTRAARQPITVTT